MPDTITADAETHEATGRALWLILDQMLRWNADAFEGDEEVNGGDMVEAFSGWRTEIKAALAASPGFQAWDKGYEAGHADGLEEEAPAHRRLLAEATRVLGWARQITGDKTEEIGMWRNLASAIEAAQ